jgi:luciferase family oxidoreductase group 1
VDVTVDLSKLPLSVLDVVPVRSGSNAREAMAETLDLARHVDALGYHRYWFAEHHGMPGIASAAPAVLVGQVAAATKTIRVGSGGVMLPNHSSLVVAEQFGTLEALFPGRIDLGLGRAPGTDQATMKVLRRTPRPPLEDEFPEQLMELFGFFSGNFPANHPYKNIRAVPAAGNQPPIWLLGSSDYSAQLAGALGLPFAFAHHFSKEQTLPALRAYRACFKPSDVLKKPYAMVAALAVLADSDVEAERLALPNALAFLRLRRGEPGLYPTVQEAQAHPWTPMEREFAADRMDGNLVGGPQRARAQMEKLLSDTKADELMLLCAVPDHAARKRSYTLLRQIQKA